MLEIVLMGNAGSCYLSNQSMVGRRETLDVSVARSLRSLTRDFSESS